MYYCIINPGAKSGARTSLWDQLEYKMKERSIPYRVVMTKGVGHAISVVKKLTETVDSAELPLKLIVMGGDGTLNEVISGICCYDQVLIGYIPVGSGNDFARDLDLPKDPDVIMDRILDGKELRRLDIGRLHYEYTEEEKENAEQEGLLSDTRMFDVSAGIGFDAAVCAMVSASKTKKVLNTFGLGTLSYGAVAIKTLLDAEMVPCDIEYDGGILHMDHMLLSAIMIHPYEGGGFKFAPEADHADGMFDVCVIGDMHKGTMMRLLPLAHSGKHVGHEGIHMLRTSHLRIRTESAMWVHTDGETTRKANCITLDCLPQKLRLMI